MRLQKKRVGAAVIVSIIMAAVRTIIIQYDMEKNDIDNDLYYLPDNLEVTVFTAAAMLLTVAFIYGGFANGRKKTVRLERSQGAVPPAALVLAFSLIGSSVIHCVFAVRDGITCLSVVDIFVLLFSILSAVKFIVSGIRYNVKLKNSFHALAAIAPIMLSVFRLLGDFINTSAAPMASSGAYHIVSLVCVLFYFLCEGKSYVAPTSGSVYYAVGYLSMFYLLVYSMPNLIIHCFGTFGFDVTAAYSILDIGLVIYIATRLTSATLVEAKKEDPAPAAE